jgi:hypothetical protein
MQADEWLRFPCIDRGPAARKPASPMLPHALPILSTHNHPFPTHSTTGKDGPLQP